MASQVTVVAILMIVQGVLEVLMGLLLVLVAFAMPRFFDMAMQQAPPPPNNVRGMPGEVKTVITIVYGVMGGAGLLVGIVRIIAGIRNLSYRGRGLGLVSLFLGILSLATVYCALTSLGLMIYGLIVYFNEQTARAFAMGERGMSRADIQEALARERYGGRDDRDRERYGDREHDERWPTPGP